MESETQEALTWAATTLHEACLWAEWAYVESERLWEEGNVSLDDATPLSSRLRIEANLDEVVEALAALRKELGKLPKQEV